MRRSDRWLAVASVVVLFRWAGAAAAQDAPPPPAPPPPSAPAPTPDVPVFDTGDVVVRAVQPDEIVRSTTTGAVPITYPGGREVIDRAYLETYPVPTIVDVVRRSPGVYSQVDTTNEWRLNVGVRGGDARRSGVAAILVDGVPVNPAPYGSIDLDVFPLTLERVERIDVIRGGAQVRYGPAAAGGVFNFITKPIPDACTELHSVVGFGSWNQWSEYVTVGGTRGRLGFQVSEVVKGGDGWRENSVYNVNDFSGKLRYRLDDRTTAAVSLSNYALDAEEAGGLTQAAYDEDPSQSLRKDDELHADVGIYSSSIVRELDACSTLTLLGYYYEQYRSFDSLRPVVAPYTKYRFQTAIYANWTVEARYETTRALGGRDHHLYASLRYANEDNHLYYHFVPPGGGPPILPHDQNNDFTTDAWAVFAEDTIDLTCDWHLALGGRFENIAIASRNRDSGLENDATHDVFLPAVSLTHDTEPGGAVYVSYQESFLPPPFDSFDPAAVNFFPLDPERARLYEVGGRLRKCGFDGSVAVFYTEYRDKITVFNDPNGKKNYSNTGEERHYGLELSGEYDLGRVTPLAGLSVYGAFTEMRNEQMNGPFEGNWTPNAPQRLASWGLRYQHPCEHFWARFGGSYTGRAYKELDNFEVGSANGVTGPQPAFTLWDAAVGYRLRSDGTGLSIALGVSNLFDEEYYRRFAQGIYPGTPRAVYGSLTYTLEF